MRSRFITLCTVLFIFIPAIQAVDIKFQHLSIEQGLSHNTVNCIYKDSFGFLWFGTSDGLNRYDGYNIKVYRNDPLNPHSLIDNKIYAIVEDTNGDLWIGSRDGLNRFNREKQSFTRLSEEGLFPENVFVRTITFDHEGTLWIGTLGDGIFYKKKGEETFNPFVIPEENQISTIAFDGDGVMWVASTRTSGIYKVSPGGAEPSYEFISFSKEMEDWQKNPFTGKTIIPGKNNNLWICTEGYGLFSYDKTANEFIRFSTTSPNFKLSNDIIKDVVETPEGIVYIATDGGGLNVYDPAKNTIEQYRYDINATAGISSDAVYSAYLDNTGILWIGTFGGGLSIYNQNIKNFEHYSQLGWNKNSLSHKSVLCFEEDHSGIIWIGTDGGGLNAFNPKTQNFTHYKNDPKDPYAINSNVITAIYEDSYNNLWIGTFANGLSRFNRKNGRFEKFNYNAYDSVQISNNVWNITEDQKGYLWVATLDGLARINLESGQLRNFMLTQENNSFHSNRVTYMLNDSRGNLWIGSQPLVRYDHRTEEFIPILPPDNVIANALDKGIRCIYESRNGKLWIGTEGGGLIGFDPALNRWEMFTEHYGLSSNAIHQILEDSTGNLWVSSNRGITRINLAKNQFRIYDINDGLQSNQFSYSAALQSGDGKMYFGGINGFNVFNPHEIYDNPHIPPVWITGFTLSNREVGIANNESPLEKNILMTEQVKLPHKAVFAFEFTALNYTSTRKNLYQYQLEGFSDEWTDPSTRRSATYTNLDPGKYIFKVRASNNDGLWNNQGDRIEVVILPPVWKTNYAYFIYVLIIIGIFIGFRNYLMSKQEMRNKLLIKDIEKKKIEEVNKLKLLFFTNISHEFRTPLTLIIGPVRQILQSDECSPKVNQKLKMVENNTQRLLNLVNQIIEFRKIETGNIRLKISQINAVDFIKTIKKAFDQYAYDHSISYGFITNVEKADVWLDKDKIDKILFNLLSNAFKFTPDGGKITISVSLLPASPATSGSNKETDRKISIYVKDNGIGIPKEKLNKIFDRFYQVDKSDINKEKARFLGTAGSGIGLSLTKDLVEHHKGTITVESEENKGSKFIVTLPAEKHAYQGEEFSGTTSDQHTNLIPLIPENIPMFENMALEDSDNTIKIEKTRLLIVEDNAELRNFLVNTLIDNYQVYQADNGLEGYEVACNQMPEIIITDIMMPVMDGIALTQKLANNSATDHIPVILLTAKSSDEAMLEGLQVGAVDYIIKPFSPDVLVHKINNINNTRKRFKEKFKQEVILQPKEVTITSQEEKFLTKAMEVIEKHISDSTFDVSVFVSEMAMSRSVLYRKLDAVIGTSANEFIRQIRLKRAAQLLQTGHMKIADVSYAVGFNDPQYFSKCFSREYGKTPTAYASAFKKNAKTS